jgi:hypothetical protein
MEEKSPARKGPASGDVTPYHDAGGCSASAARTLARSRKGASPPRLLSMTGLWAAGIGAAVLVGLLSRKGERSGRDGGDIEESPPSPERVDQLLRAGRKIDAIKVYRRLHGVDLKSAKDAIDARAGQLRP